MQFIRLDLALAALVTLQGHVSNIEDIGVIGVRIHVLSDTVSEVHPGTPAEEAGILKGDRIVSVDGNPFGEITGPPESLVTLKIKRGKEYIEFKVRRVALHSLPQLNRSNYPKNR